MGRLRTRAQRRSTVAIQDRNLSVGTRLWARYKGTTHTAEVVDVEGSLKYRLPDGREYVDFSSCPQSPAIVNQSPPGADVWSVLRWHDRRANG
jgi:hypothetical protein